MKSDQLDPITFSKAKRVVSAAQSQGYDQIEALHASGLILSPAQRRKIRLEALREFQTVMMTYTTGQFFHQIRVKPEVATAEDLRRSIHQFVNDYIAREAAKK
jgi:hypothetical protein